ncbi:MAG: prepilin-type N-terminal cleavage/methylation domain-containing protein, partial [Thermodesulfobacteria bacterium]|nr:prepilin-type N-terminal cleavage/methylation domain-containing protein [Thermodesulfobacteriota bacterium]
MRGVTSKGFTLVELAIVLVIIGIILGGVLKGQAIIENARIKRVQNDLKSIEASMWTFYDRYNRMPGDCDRNGTIDA